MVTNKMSAQKKLDKVEKKIELLKNTMCVNIELIDSLASENDLIDAELARLCKKRHKLIKE